MQESIAACIATRLLRRANFVELPQHTEIQNTPAFRVNEDVKASRIQVWT
jgi:hypothetical protein